MPFLSENIFHTKIARLPVNKKATKSEKSNAILIQNRGDFSKDL
jgi:hypothetical protein